MTTSRITAVWRLSTIADDSSIVDLCIALNAEDPGPDPVSPENMRRTLATLRSEPSRGRAVVLQGDEGNIGYALLISFWSNELGGEVCTIDELYVVPAARNVGLGASLFERILDGTLWPTKPVALTLETTPSNTRARSLYERIGFVEQNITMRLRIS